MRLNLNCTFIYRWGNCRPRRDHHLPQLWPLMESPRSGSDHRKSPQSSNLLTQRRLIGPALNNRDQSSRQIISSSSFCLLSHLSSTISCTNARIKKWPFQLFTWTNNKRSSRYSVSAHNLTPLVVATGTEGAFGRIQVDGWIDRLRRLSSSTVISVLVVQQLLDNQRRGCCHLLPPQPPHMLSPSCIGSRGPL